MSSPQRLAYALAEAFEGNLLDRQTLRAWPAVTDDNGFGSAAREFGHQSGMGLISASRWTPCRTRYIASSRSVGMGSSVSRHAQAVQTIDPVARQFPGFAAFRRVIPHLTYLSRTCCSRTFPNTRNASRISPIDPSYSGVGPAAETHDIHRQQVPTLL